MRISYYAQTDSLHIQLKGGVELEGEEVAEGIVFHYNEAGEVVSIEMDSSASTLADVRTLEAFGIERVVSMRTEGMVSSG